MAIADDLRAFISKGETKKALEQLAAFAKAKDNNLYNMVLLLQGRFTRNESNQLLGVVAEAETALELNRINLAVIELIPRADAIDKMSATTATPVAPVAPRTGIDPNIPISIFVSFSHDDEDLLLELNKQLAPLKRNPALKVWADFDIIASQEWDSEIKNSLMSADIVLLLVSPGFLSSDYIYSNELNVAMARHENGEAAVVPVILRPCDWKNETFARLQGLPKGVKPVVSWASRDEAFLDIVTGLKKVIMYRQQKKLV